MTERRTKRRYAHELYPHAEEGETRPLEVEVPYRLARAIGLQLEGTSWTTADPETTGQRVMEMINETRIALLAVALHESLSGDEAWTYADEALCDEMWQLFVACKKYDVPVDQIKPYPCGPEPDHHDHLDTPDARGWQIVHWIDGRESDCPECTEEVPDEV